MEIYGDGERENVYIYNSRNYLASIGNTAATESVQSTIVEIT